MSPQKILNIAVPSPQSAFSLGKALGVSSLTAQLLINRGVTDPDAARDFLCPSLQSLHDPFTFREMALAVNLVKKAGRDGRRVLIYGDYDVDGVTSVTVLKAALSRLNISASHYIPHRVREGYGLNSNVFELVGASGAGMVITADCGTNSVGIIRELRARGVEVIVTDHHEPSFSPDHPASALINPKVPASAYQYKELAGVGVAFKFCQALTGERLFDELDLVSLGTIADSVPLTGENRVIAKEGMARIGSTTRPGLRRLIDCGGIGGREITAENVSFILAPRINASGRMDTAESSLRLLLCDQPAEAEALAGELEQCNRRRQKEEARIMEEAQAVIDREVNFKEHKVIVLAKEGWHPGCLGIVASKLADKFHRPAVLITLDESGKCRGSGRSIRGFHLFDGLCHCRSLLCDFGGHEHAVGLSIESGNIPRFRELLNGFALEKLPAGGLIPVLDVDMEVGLHELTPGAAQELERLEPFGEGNGEPVFFTRGLTLKGVSRVMGRQTLKFWVTDGKFTYPAVGFGMASLKPGLDCCRELWMAYRPKIDRWQGMETLTLEVKEVFLK